MRMPLQLFNSVGWKANLSESSLMNAAMRRAGLKDFGDEPWRPRLQRLLGAIEDEARTLLGDLRAKGLVEDAPRA